MLRRLAPGYCYVLDGEPGVSWRCASDDDWPVEVFSPDGQEEYVGRRRIDFCSVEVFFCPDGRYRAQLLASVIRTT